MSRLLEPSAQRVCGRDAWHSIPAERMICITVQQFDGGQPDPFLAIDKEAVVNTLTSALDIDVKELLPEQGLKA